MIVVNFKLYENGIDAKGLELIRVCRGVSRDLGVKIYCVVSPLLAGMVEQRDDLLLGHVDNVELGRNTGYVSVNEARIMQIGGSLLNHSEHKLKMGVVGQTLKKMEKDFISIVCVHSVGQAERWLVKMRPKYIAYEPSYLIASKTASVVSERIDALKKIIEIGKIKGVGVLAGAGVKTEDDVRAILQAGGGGILVASEVVLSSNPKDKLMELAKLFGKN